MQNGCPQLFDFKLGGNKNRLPAIEMAVFCSF
jgi:hypothetical protein